MSLVIVPQIFVRGCDEITAFEDREIDCLEITIGSLKILVFSDQGIPAIRKIGERETA